MLTPQGDQLAWDAVGTGWEVEVSRSEIHVVAPWELEAARCVQGAAGSTEECAIRQPEPGHLVADVGSLDAGEGATIYAAQGRALPGGAPALPAPPTSAPPDPGAGLLLPAAVAAADVAWAVPGLPAGEVLVDHEELAELVTTEFAPPEGVRAPMGGIVHAESVRPEHKVAWLIEAAIDGSVDLVDEGHGRVRLERTAPGAADTAAVLDVAFAGRSTVDLGSYDPQFARGWAMVDGLLERWQRDSGLWDAGADRRRVAVRALGALAAVAGAAGLALGGALASRWGEGWLALVAAAGLVAGTAFAAALRGWELRVRTPKGSGLWLRIESFRRFLAGSEAFHAEEAAERGVLREYTAWAVALGEIDRWEHAVATSGAIPAQAGLGYVHLAPALLVATAATATAPSSSGGGGGGGGVGGGGGGGGGGSW